jgi:hypothetical protein
VSLRKELLCEADGLGRGCREQFEVVKIFPPSLSGTDSNDLNPGVKRIFKKSAQN